ncbi:MULTISPECIES: flavin-containing monooxygenase [unclassified Mycolicibacterium]|uniref:flavin-containing monooxygenase n=1 Tax=unclassified Mycolicibacterium TaxID=2636767 RepID=UPI002ED85488
MTTEARNLFDAIVIGAGPSGLAVARELQHRHGVGALILDRAGAPAYSWRTRYDNFRLNTSGFLSHLPGQRIPVAAGRWPSREDMVAYFDSYVERQNISLCYGCEVNRIDRGPDGWQLDTSSGNIRTPVLVLATGNYRTPVIPPWPGLSDFTGEVTHSAGFRNAQPYRDLDVLVVGAGNSAADIAVQLADNGAGRIWLSVRTPPHLVRRALGPIPSDVFLELSARVPASVVDPLIARTHRLVWGTDLSVYGFQRPPMGLKATVEQRGRIPTFADELVDAVRAGRIEVVSAVQAVGARSVTLADGSSVAPDAIIAATGFSPDLDELVGHLGVLDDRGNPRGGFACHIGDGLFTIGYGIPPNSPLRSIRRHATRLARDIARYLAESSTKTQVSQPFSTANGARVRCRRAAEQGRLR